MDSEASNPSTSREPTTPPGEARSPEGDPASTTPAVSTESKGSKGKKVVVKSRKTEGSKDKKKSPKKSKRSTRSTKKVKIETLTEETKSTAKAELLGLIKEEGCTWMDASEVIRDRYGYHRTTPYKWLKDIEGYDEDEKPITYRDLVRAAERIRIADAHRTLLRAAKGGELTGLSDEDETVTTIEYQADGVTPRKKHIKSKRKHSESYSPPNGAAARDFLIRTLQRNRRLGKDDSELERVPSPLVLPTEEDLKDLPITGKVIFLMQPLESEKKDESDA